MGFFYIEPKRISKKIIFINESQLKYLIESSISSEDVYNKYYKDKLDKKEFYQIIEADPTYRDNKIGKYAKWLLNIYFKGNLKIEDLYKATEYLNAFTKYKNRIADKDINHYQNLVDLYNAVKDLLETNAPTSKQDEIRRIKEQETEVIYNSSDWEIVIPKTWEASKLYGANTQWCTASKESSNFFDTYSSEGNLYILINKPSNRKFQFHFPSNQFMDETDNDIKDSYGDYYDTSIQNLLGLPNSIIDLFNKLGEDTIKLTFPPKGNIFVTEKLNDYEPSDVLRLIPNEKNDYALFMNEEQLSNYEYDSKFKFGEHYIILQHTDNKNLKDIFVNDNFGHFVLINQNVTSYDFVNIYSNVDEPDLIVALDTQNKLSFINIEDMEIIQEIPNTEEVFFLTSTVCEVRKQNSLYDFVHCIEYNEVFVFAPKVTIGAKTNTSLYSIQ